MSARMWSQGDSEVSPPASGDLVAAARARRPSRKPSTKRRSVATARGHGEREEGGEGLGAHGGEIAESAGEGTVADGGGGVPVAAEVAAFEREVGGNEEFVTAGRGKDGAVVADAEAEGAGAAASDGGSLANALDPGKLPFGCPG